MTDAKHTPGPWTLLVARTLAHIKSAGGALIASVPFGTDRERANARLIAAAPEMLAALRLARPVLAALIDPAMQHVASANVWAQAKEAEAKARAAIAKATGEDQ